MCHQVRLTGALGSAAELAAALGALLAADAVVLGADDGLLPELLALVLEHAVTANAVTAAIAVALAMWRVRAWRTVDVECDLLGKRLVRLVMNVPSARVPHSTRVPGGGVRPSRVVPEVTENVTIVPTAALR